MLLSTVRSGLTSPTYIPRGHYFKSLQQKLGLESGVGPPEDAISHDTRYDTKQDKPIQLWYNAHY
jgi:hypothetical protein